MINKIRPTIKNNSHSRQEKEKNIVLYYAVLDIILSRVRKLYYTYIYIGFNKYQ